MKIEQGKSYFLESPSDLLYDILGQSDLGSRRVLYTTHKDEYRPPALMTAQFYRITAEKQSRTRPSSKLPYCPLFPREGLESVIAMRAIAPNMVGKLRYDDAGMIALEGAQNLVYRLPLKDVLRLIARVVPYVEKKTQYSSCNQTQAKSARKKPFTYRNSLSGQRSYPFKPNCLLEYTNGACEGQLAGLRGPERACWGKGCCSAGCNNSWKHQAHKRKG